MKHLFRVYYRNKNHKIDWFFVSGDTKQEALREAQYRCQGTLVSVHNVGKI